MPVDAAIYTRRQEAANPEAVEEQLRACHQMAEREGLRVIGTYHDVGSANAALPLRPGLCALLEDAKKRKFDVLLVSDHARLSRNIVAGLKLLRRLQALKIRVLETSGSELCWSPQLARLVSMVFEQGRLRSAEIAKRLNEEAGR